MLVANTVDYSRYTQGFIYLCSPYSHDDPVIRQTRYELAMDYKAMRMKEGVVLYSPIIESHLIAIDKNLPTDFEFWKHYDFNILSQAKGVEVLMLDGWHLSKGVTQEVEFAKALDIPIIYVSPEYS